MMYLYYLIIFVYESFNLVDYSASNADLIADEVCAALNINLVVNGS